MVFALLLALLLDAASVATGAWLLWINSSDTVFGGSFAGTVLAFASCGVLIVLRQILLHWATASRTRERARLEALLLGGEMLLFVALLFVWLSTGRYVLGWFACFAAALLLLGSALQLMRDVLIGPYRQSKQGHRVVSILARRLLSLEVLRLLAALLAMLGLVMTSSIHEWMPQLLNPLIFSLATTLAIAAGLTGWLLAMRSRQSCSEAV